MYTKTDVLKCLKMLMFDFTHHNIDMACALLETCGRYLYRSPDSHHRTRIYLVTTHLELNTSLDIINS